MTTSGTVKISKVWKMLRKCAEGHEVTEQPHSFRIDFFGRTYWNFPRGKRKLKDPEVEAGHIKKMARHLRLDFECVEKYLPQVKPLSQI